MVCHPFRTATLVDNETIEGQIGEGCQVRLVLPVVGKETCWEGDPILHLDKVHPELATKVDMVEQL